MGKRQWVTKEGEYSFIVIGRPTVWLLGVWELGGCMGAMGDEGEEGRVVTEIIAPRSP